MGIGEDIKRRRLAAKMSQRGLARQAGINQPNLNRIESGRENITLDILRSIATALDCSVIDLLAKESNKNPKGTPA
jgi:transcriptional regulator with XRE-family HTH domain